MTDAWPDIPDRVHLIGIGGSGMAALGHCLLDMNRFVSGSDLHVSIETDQLRRRGAEIHRGHAAANLSGAALVVVSDAIPASNIELTEARIRGIAMLRRAECLDRLARPRQAIMVAGSHGKSTTSAMIATVLEQAGARPSFAIGASVPALEGRRARVCHGRHFVVEACEAFQNLAAFHPDLAIITNIDDEHLDHYGSQDRLDEAFIGFANRARTGVFVNGDDPGVQRILPRITRPVTTFGLGSANDVRAARHGFDAGASRLDIRCGDRPMGTISLPLPGRHVILNALAGFAACDRIGIGFDDIRTGLGRFTGVGRRWQRIDAGGRIEIIDDYAHHPRELATILDTARSVLKRDRRLVIAFQPQLFSRTGRLFAEFAAELARCDAVLLLEVDGAGERDPGDGGSSRIAQEILRRGGMVERFDDVDDLVARGPDHLRDGDCVIVAGAGNIREAAERLGRRYREDEAFPAPASPATPARKAGLVSRLGRAVTALPWRERGVLDLLREQAGRRPAQPAVSFGDRQLSYAGLDAASDLLAGHLRDRGLACGDVAGVRLPSSIELIVTIVALAKLGAVYLPLDASLPAERTNFMLGQTAARWLITTREAAFQPALPDLAVIYLEEIRAWLAAPAADRPAPAHAPPASDALAYICFTSGSTGQPKGVAIRHGSLANLVAATRGLFGIDHRTRMALNTSISFDVSLGEIWMTLCGGGDLRATGSFKPLVGERLGGFFEHDAITHTAITPSVLASLPSRPLPALTCIIAAGEACPPALVDAWAPGRRFFNAYGPTEATIYATVALCRERTAVTIGKPLRNVTIRVLDHAGAAVPAGEVGELCLGGAGLADGYLHLEAETSAKFIELPSRPGRTERLYRTGDMVRAEADGTLSYLGRIDSQVKILGNRIELEEIEATIRRHPHLQDVAVCVDERHGGKDLVCFAVLNAADEFDWATAREDLAAWLPAYMIPSALVPVGEILLTPSGKKDRRGMLSRYRSRIMRRTEYVGPRNEIEAKVAAIWKDLLGAETDIGVYEDFGYLGGDSLKGLLLVMEVEKSFGIAIPPGYFTGFTTIFRMSVQIADLLWNREAPGAAREGGFRSTRIYKQLRDLTAGWQGGRAREDAITVSAGGDRPAYELFLCLQEEEELHGFATHLGSEFRVHAMRSGHLVMDYTAEATQALCDHYIEELEAIGPTGRILIGGICQGGIIATAMAERLRAKGHAIPLLVLMEQSRLMAYDGEVAFFYSEDSFLNPMRRYTSGLARYDEIYRHRYSADTISGTHGAMHRPPNVQSFVGKLKARLVELERDDC